MKINKFKSILFDLDDTLYQRGTGPIDEVEKNINKFVMNFFDLSEYEAVNIRKQYSKKYGTTLRGLIAEHKIKIEDYINAVYDVNVTKYLSKDEMLIEILKSINIKKYILTNSHIGYALRVLEALNITAYFDKIFDNSDMNFESKSTEECYKNILDKINCAPSESIMVDDVDDYLINSKKIGMFTILVNDSAKGMFKPDLQIKNIYELWKFI